MKQAALILGAALALGGTGFAAAQTQAPPPAPFACTARAPNVCYFRIFYSRGDRVVVLPAGMKANVPDVIIGTNSYCMALGKAPMVISCPRKIIAATTNS